MKNSLGILLFLSSTWALAASPAVVDGVQMPAWVERLGLLSPLAPGMELQSLDTLRTGRNARVLLRMAEGSLVKLGENGLLRLTNLDRADDGKSVFKASLDVLKGAFRFTTDKLAGLRQRDVQVRVASITAGIRGTDVWGKADDDKDIVCLIEGKISVQRGQEPAFSMEDPLSFYIAPKNQPALPVQPVPMDKLAQWAKETEIGAGQGALRQGGKWKVNLVSASTQDAALDVYANARRKGYPAKIDPVKKGARYTYHVRIAQLPSQEEAEVLALRLTEELGIPKPTVTR